MVERPLRFVSGEEMFNQHRVVLLGLPCELFCDREMAAPFRRFRHGVEYRGANTLVIGFDGSSAADLGLAQQVLVHEAVNLVTARAFVRAHA